MSEMRAIEEIDPPLFDYEKVKELARRGAKPLEIAAVFGVPEKQMMALQKSDKKLIKAINEGRAGRDEFKKLEYEKNYTAFLQLDKNREIDLNTVYDLASDLLTDEQIGRCLGMNPVVFERRKAQDPRIGEIIERARAEVSRQFGRKFKEMALAGNINAIMFYMRTKMNMIEKNEISITHASDVSDLSDADLMKLVLIDDSVMLSAENGTEDLKQIKDKDTNEQ